MMNKDGAGQDNRTRALLHDLRELGRLDARDEAFGQDLRARLLQQAHQQTTSHDERMPHMITTLDRPRPLASRRPPSMRLRVASVAAAVLLALSGVAGYLRWQTPTPVSAQSILRHAAAALPLTTPDQVVHDVSTAHTINAPGVNAGIGGVSASIAPTVTVDRWIQWNANGAPTRDDTSIINGTNPAGLLLQRVVQVGRTTMVYDAPTRTTTVMTATMAATRAAPPERPVVPDPFNPVSLRRFVLDAQQGTAHDARLLPRQMLDGVTVDVVQVMRALPGYGQGNTDKTPRQDTVTFYVDAGTYALRQVDIASVNAKGALLTSSIVRVVIYALVPAASVPSTVFSLHAPANGRVVTVPHTR